MNETHQSATDPEARLYEKSYGKESKLAYLGHALVENRNGLIAAAMATQADGYAERDAALLMLNERQKTSSRRITVGADKACDTKDFIAGARELNVTAHVQKNEKGRRSNLEGRTTRHSGYAVSLSRRWLVEKTFGWLKQTGPIAQVKLRGLAKVDWLFIFNCAAHNLLRLPKLFANQLQQDPQQQCASNPVESSTGTETAPSTTTINRKNRPNHRQSAQSSSAKKQIRLFQQVPRRSASAWQLPLDRVG